MRRLLVVAAAVVAAAGGAAGGSNNTVMFLEALWHGAGDPARAVISATVAAHGGREFHVLSMMTWPGPVAPNATAPGLPPPDADAVAFLAAARAGAPAPLAVWGGVSLCPGPEYACMLNLTLATAVGGQLAAAVAGAGLDGVVVYASPYCNNANCKKTTGKYAEGLAAIVRAYKAVAAAMTQPLGIALPLNEWDNCQIVAAAGPTAVFSWQTVFYFTSITDCQAQNGALCGAGENVAYVTRAKANFTAITTYLASHGVRFIGQFDGASTPPGSNPPDFWPALEAYAAGGA
jgi:hypothetical protein